MAAKRLVFNNTINKFFGAMIASKTGIHKSSLVCVLGKVQSNFIKQMKEGIDSNKVPHITLRGEFYMINAQGVNYMNATAERRAMITIREAWLFSVTILDGVTTPTKNKVFLKSATGAVKTSFQNPISGKGGTLDSKLLNRVFKTDVSNLTPKVKKKGYEAFVLNMNEEKGAEAMEKHIIEAYTERAAAIKAEAEKLEKIIPTLNTLDWVLLSPPTPEPVKETEGDEPPTDNANASGEDLTGDTPPPPPPPKDEIEEKDLEEIDLSDLTNFD